MSYTNSYTAPTPPPPLPQGELYGPNPYDLNFVYPLHIASLETPRAKLVPFIPRVHADHFWTCTKDADLFRYFPLTWATKEDFLTYLERGVRQNPSTVLLAIVDKTKPDLEHPEFHGGSLAGVIGLYHSAPSHLSTESGFVAILPPFQRTHVASNAVGVLLKYCLELHSADFPGLGLRRVEWKAHAKNAASARLAERMGFNREGLIRWSGVLPLALARDGKKPRPEDVWPDRYGRDSVVLSATWEDWENGGRELAQKHVDRKY
ncbi:acyl-CoA N-acyltransferase [Irpex lacteus]|nr:acyl-CoA N-acyltransferase [Irpex lacteus]